MKKGSDNWKYLPDLLLEEIFHYLTWPERLLASCTCRAWHQTFFSPSLWKTLVYKPPSYLEKYSQRSYYDVATINISKCFKSVGHCFKSVTILPTSDYFILNRVLNVTAEFYRRQKYFQSSTFDDNPFSEFRCRLRRLYFEFACQIENDVMYGTGGTMLESIKRLLDTVTNLKEVKVKGLLLDVNDQRGLFDLFILNNQNSLTSLSLVNISKTSVFEYGLIRLHYLQYLELGVYELNAELLISLVQETRLKILVLTQTRFTLTSVEFSVIDPIPNHVWSLALDINPDLKLHQVYLFDNISDIMDFSTLSVTYQPHPAPVTRFIYSSNSPSLLDLHKLDFYHSTFSELIIIIDDSEESSSRSSLDQELFEITYNCPHLETLALGGNCFSIYSATILQLLLEGSKKVKNMFIEEKVVEYSLQNMSPELFNAYASNELIPISSNSDLFISTVRSHLKIPNWNLLKREQFYKLMQNKKYY